MKSVHLRFTLAVAALIGLALTPALAQQRQPSPEQRIERLERQLRQVQSRVYPRGQPVDTAGFIYEPAATQASVTNLDNRIAGLERMLTDILRQTEETSNRVRQMEAELGRVRTEQNRRLQSLEAQVAEMAAAATNPLASGPATGLAPGPQASQPRVETSPTTVRPPATSNGAVDEEAAEEAYSIGFRLWRDGKYQEAISALRAFTAAYPNHRRVSWANNLTGRAMLDAGQPRAAAEVLLANYRSNPRGERAQDSLFYLGQSLVKLGQLGQACKAYAELEEVYGAGVRAELRTLLARAKTDARCG